MRNNRWFRRAVLLLLVVFATSQGLSWSLRLRRLHDYLTGRLEAAFGRPVEVSVYEFSLLGGPRLVADFVTVGEDARFGREYFLRAERLTASLRWQALLRGRLEFGTFSFSHPSLNLVRASDGHWNLESWLPPPGPAGSSPSAANPPQLAKGLARLYRIEIDSGRINFKRGADKHPFALVELKGYVAQEAAGLWRIDLEARPMRAAVVVQEAGTIRVRGRIGGTSARLRPVDLALTWQDVSVADALRLARGKDYGVRGRLALEVAARSNGAQWTFAATARMANVHRWDLPHRSGDPALNLTVEAAWWPQEARVELTKCILEAPRSNIRATGFAEWAQHDETRFRLVSAGIRLEDLLVWYRAFHPGVAEDLAVEGNAELDLEIGGWPLRVERGALASDGAVMRFGASRAPVRLGHVVLRIAPGRAELLPTVITLAGEGAALRVDAKAEHRSGWKFALNLAAQTGRVQDALAAAAALGWNLGRGWRLEGGAGLKMRWQGSLYPFEAQPSGVLELAGARLHPPFLNQPVSLEKARIEQRGEERRVTLGSAQAFGARWSGTLRSRGSGEPWEFSLTADRLDVAELDRWLNPRSPLGLQGRLVPGAAESTVARPTGRDEIRARGRLSVDQFSLEPLVLRGLRAELQLAGGNLDLLGAQAQFYGGTVRGSLRAEISSEPVYRIQAQFRQANLAALLGAAPTLAGRFAGSASGEMALVARGVGRQSLLLALEGRGQLQVQGVQIRGFDLRQSLVAGSRRPGSSEFQTALGEFTLAAGKVQVKHFRLKDSAGELEAEGSVDFSRVLDLQVRPLAPSLTSKAAAFPSSVAGQAFRVTGPLDSPQIAPGEPAARPR